jgi:hypothetical protein
MEQRLKSIRIKKIERFDRYISGQPFTVVTYPDAPHPGSISSFDADCSIFDDKAPLRRCADPPGRAVR